jgi:hypothetical protein
MAVIIPKSQEAAVARLFQMSEPDFARFFDALKAVEPSISLSDLAERTANAAEMDKSDVRSLVSYAAGLYTFGDIDEQGDFLAELIGAVRSSSNEELRSIPEAELAVGQDRIKRLMGLHTPLGVSAKSLNLLIENERLYCDGRILTDLRPIFLEDATAPPEASVIIHSLRLAFHERDELRHIYFALSTDDLRELKTLVDRALEKEEGLRAIAAKGGIPCLQYSAIKD